MARQNPLAGKVAVVVGGSGGIGTAICRRFLDDQNRALVWMIRFSALQTWGARSDVTTWLQRGPGTTRDALEVAAGFPLNEGWEFDTERFCSAIDVLVSCRTATPQA